MVAVSVPGVGMSNPRLDDPERTGAAGVAIAVHKRLARQASTTPGMLNSAAARGHCQVITLHHQGAMK